MPSAAGFFRFCPESSIVGTIQILSQLAQGRLRRALRAVARENLENRPTEQSSRYGLEYFKKERTFESQS
jgi:hypothetical protein